MEEPAARGNVISDFDKIQKLVGYSDNELSPVKTSTSTGPKSDINFSGSSDDDQTPVHRMKKRIKQFSDSDTDKENLQNDVETEKHSTLPNNIDSENEEDSNNIKNNFKSRIQLNNSDSDDSEGDRAVKNVHQQMRMKNKRNMIKDKFKNLLSSREKSRAVEKHISSNDDSEVSEKSDTEMSSIKSIKQKIKESMSMIPSICDPDTSEEEESASDKYVNKPKLKKQRKSTKPTSPKPMRMSAKQAMDNMQKIKSESNRMQREKEVTLPYHRPKALSLKDIMSRRRPALTSDGKALPIKMNGEQLKQYAQLLEERQKEMMELCKSDTEEDDTAEPDHKDILVNENNDNSEVKHDSNTIHENLDNKTTDIPEDNALENDSSTINTLEISKITETNSTDKGKVIQPNETDNNVQLSEEQNSFDTDMKLVYNDSTEDIPKINVDEHSEASENIVLIENGSEDQIEKVSTEQESQMVDLHYDTEKSEPCVEELDNIGEPEKIEELNNLQNQTSNVIDISIQEHHNSDFLSDDDMNIDDIDKIIENAEILENNVNSPMLVKEPALHVKPKLTGAPGMVIDLDGNDPFTKKLSGVELLKERFSFFAKLKTPEELEREREKKIKPGAQLVKLKQELEEKIAEQRSLEWAKRLEDEKQQQMEMNAIRGDTSDAEDDIDKIEAKLADSNEKEISSESEEELIEDDVEIKDKPKKRNPMVDDEAEVSESEDNEGTDKNLGEPDEGIEADDEEMDNDNTDNESSEEESESEEEQENAKPKKGRILKAFEDSDDEDATKQDSVETTNQNNELQKVLSTQTNSQDDEIQLAQRHKSVSDDMFSSQDAASTISIPNDTNKDTNINDTQVATQTFSILDSKLSDTDFKSPEVLDVITQPYHDPNLDALAAGLSQNVLGSQFLTQSSQSQPIGEDVLALCTGKFYDNEFVSQTEESQYDDPVSQEDTNDIVDDRVDGNSVDNDNGDVTVNREDNVTKKTNTNHSDIVDGNDKDAEVITETVAGQHADNSNKDPEDGNLLKSILDELDDPEFDTPKPSKFFAGAAQKKNEETLDNTQLKKKFVIDSDDEADVNDKPTNKKLKKKRAEQRALQLSDDEEEEELEQEDDEYMSDIEDDTEKLVEYDSEENEIELIPQKPAKKRKAAEFLENEAELTSEDEWVGSGDEDEAGLDRMEREAGDDDVFHQGQLRSELGQIHMREVLDQDKREVRLIQELLLEDGDLGDGHRQRKFRWRNADGGEEMGTIVDEFGDTQEEEFESEEQWRKQRHEREVFLREMQSKEEDEDLNVSVNRTTIIKANLSSRTMSSLLMEVNQSKTEKAESPVVPEKKTAKDIPSPKKSFTIFQQNYHGSLLTRGRGALARLAALATPLAADDDAPKIGSLAPSSKRNFVFAALTPDEKPKATTKRKADNAGTPKLVKKMKKEEKQNTKYSLLDHLKAL